jgi:hypothetical protein
LQSQNKIQANKDLDSLANGKFDIPGDSGFPLNAVYAKPASKKDEGFYKRVNKAPEWNHDILSHVLR